MVYSRTFENMKGRIMMETGIDCPDCGHNESKVYKTKNYFHKIIRYRKCSVCGKNFHTEESRKRKNTISSIDLKT